MNWVRTLVLAPDEILEERVKRIIEYIIAHYNITICHISDIDATGEFGNQLTQKINDGDVVSLQPRQVLNLFREEGQVFELYLDMISGNKFHIRISDGIYVDIFSDVPLPHTVVGNSMEGDLDNI